MHAYMIHFECQKVEDAEQTFGHAVKLSKHASHNILSSLVPVPSTTKLEKEFVVRILVRRIAVMQVFNGSKMVV